MCDCRSDIEKRLLDHVGKQLPEGSRNLSVSLQGYAFGVTDGGMKMQNVMPIAVEYEEPVKKKPGEFKRKKQTQNMWG